MATDIFTLNTALAATIEDSMVKTLNELRSVWDPRDEYETYAFVRQPQTFPDVVLRQIDNGEDVLLGIAGSPRLAMHFARSRTALVSTPGSTSTGCSACVLPWRTRRA